MSVRGDYSRNQVDSAENTAVNPREKDHGQAWSTAASWDNFTLHQGPACYSYPLLFNFADANDPHETESPSQVKDGKVRARTSGKFQILCS